MIQPLHDHLVVDRVPPEDRIGLIVVPDKAKERPRIATVLAIGPGKKRDDGRRMPMADVQVGDRVLIDKWAGHEIKLQGETVVIISDDDLHAVLPPETSAVGHA